MGGCFSKVWSRVYPRACIPLPECSAGMQRTGLCNSLPVMSSDCYWTSTLHTHTRARVRVRVRTHPRHGIIVAVWVVPALPWIPCESADLFPFLNSLPFSETATATQKVGALFSPRRKTGCQPQPVWWAVLLQCGVLYSVRDEF